MDPEKSWKEDDYFSWFYQFDSTYWFELSQKRERTSGAERKFLYDLGRRSSRGKIPTIKQLKWARSIVKRIELEKRSAVIIRKSKGGTKRMMAIPNIKHATVRMAWHGNKWNGRICLDPEKNEYCVGEFSLLSNRLRRRRNLEIEGNRENRGEVPDKKRCGGYIPPCYWSLNAFGTQEIEIEHEHPMIETNKNIKDTPAIPETLPPSSVFTWPFKLSFIRDKSLLSKTDGKYPKNLELRIEHFFSQFRKEESIIFLYCNYDNPISADEYKYLIVGCSLLKDKGREHHYKIPEDGLREIRSGDGFQNFPTIGWEYRLTLNEQYSIRLPYHEYLEEAERTNNFDFLNEVRVIVDEPELEQNFKYVAMDIDDDHTIYLLTKIKRGLLKVKKHGRFNDVYDVDANLGRAEDLLKIAWQKRGHFPGFNKLNRVILDREDDLKPLKTDSLIKRLIGFNAKNYYEELSKLIEDPESAADMWEEAVEELHQIKDFLEVKRLHTEEYLKLCMLNLTPFQFRRILKGDIGDIKISVNDVIENPYLLYEEYEPVDEDDPITGEHIDAAIDLFKVDIAYFPDTRYLSRLRKIQHFNQADPVRVRSLIISHLKNLEGKGDCFDTASSIENHIKDYPLFYKSEYHLPDNLLSDPKDSEVQHYSKKLVIEKDGRRLFYYLDEIYAQEQFISQRIIDLLKRPNLSTSYRFDSMESCQSLKERIGVKFDEEGYRKERVLLYPTVFEKRIFVLSGSPGSGKSYELMRIVDTLQESGEKCLILTPTGKAALRLSLNDEGFEDVEAMTIDKYLTENRDSADGSIEIENLVIDEMSMVSLPKFYELLKKINFGTKVFKRLILVGDEHQLPPIGFGKVFIDIVRYILSNQEFQNNYVFLDVNCRQELDDTIINFAKIYSGQNKYYEPLIRDAIKGGEVSSGLHINYWSTIEELREQITERFKVLFKDIITNDDLNLALNRIFNLYDNGFVNNEDYKFYERVKMDGFQILTPYRAGFYGSIGLNNFVQEEFRGDTQFLRGKFSFKHSDKIIQIKNLYSKKGLILSNGSMGIVVKRYKNNFYFPEFRSPLSGTSLKEDELELAYTITVHKAQGSGFDHVFLVIPAKKGLLFRELLYTALTRSKQALSIFAYGIPNQPMEESLFELIRGNSSVELRKTSLLGNPYWDYSLSPEEGVDVRSRVEYIIYKKLQEYRDELSGDLDFSFRYEADYKPVNRSFTIKPDFTITLPANRTIYLEHLGLLTDRSYRRNWFDKLDVYKEEGLLDSLVTTDEIGGLRDDSISKVVEDILFDEIISTDYSYSKHHYSIGT